MTVWMCWYKEHTVGNNALHFSTRRALVLLYAQPHRPIRIEYVPIVDVDDKGWFGKVIKGSSLNREGRELAAPIPLNPPKI